MKSLVADVDESGRSCVLKEIPIEPRESNEGPSSRIDLYQVRETPPPPRPPGKGGYHETGLEAGHLEFLVLQMPPGIEHPNHHTDTLNFYTVVQGSVDVLLDDGAHLLETGDSIAFPGIDHGWRAGPSGCTMTIVNVGSTRPI